MEKFFKKNAVLYKEMTVDMKTPKAMIIIMIMNVIIGFIAMLFLGIMTMVGIVDEAYISYRVLPWMLTAIYYIEAGMIMFLVPAITAGSISLEKERQTLDVLLTTRMTPWEIIVGKYFSNVVFVVLLILSSLPVLSLVFIYGGFPMWKLLLLILVLVAITCFFSSFGVFFSALTKNTIISVVLTYIAVGAVLSLSAAATGVGIGVIEAINAVLADKLHAPDNLIPSDEFIFFLLINPIVTVFDIIGSCVGYTFDGEGIAGMSSIGEILPHFTSKNILLRSWTVLSVILQLAVSFVILRVSAAFITVKKPKRNKKRDYGMK